MKEKWWSIALRHVASVVLAVTIIWTIMKPHAEAFVRVTVNDRITKIEQKLDDHESLLHSIIRRLDVIHREVR